MADRYPNSRDEQLHMVKTWNAVFAANGQRAAWGIPQPRLTALDTGSQTVNVQNQALDRFSLQEL